MLIYTVTMVDILRWHYGLKIVILSHYIILIHGIKLRYSVGNERDGIGFDARAVGKFVILSHYIILIHGIKLRYSDDIFI